MKAIVDNPWDASWENMHDHASHDEGANGGTCQVDVIGELGGLIESLERESLEGDVEERVKAALEEIRKAPEGERIKKAEELHIFDLLGKLDDIRRERYAKELARLLGVTKPTVLRSIRGKGELDISLQEEEYYDLEEGKAFAEQLGEGILEEVVRVVHDLGVVGEERNVKLIYLALTSRQLEDPVSLVVKGPSSAGKSYTVEKVLELFPPSAYIARTALSPKALAYSEESFAHRTLVIFEADGIKDGEGAYLLRSLLSEGRIVYETVEKKAFGLRPLVINKEGPANCILTTTRINLHPENETRLLTLMVDDSPEQTKAILLRTAQASAKPDLARWRALQAWLDSEPCKVVVPYAEKLAKLVKPVDVRLRRDFKTIISLIKAHALLHKACRERDEQGRVVATMQDYEAVRELVADPIAYQVEQKVKPIVRETVEVVRGILEEGAEYATMREVGKRLGLGRNATSRRVQEAIEQGFLVDVSKSQKEGETRGRQKRLVLGDPLPTESHILPLPEELEEGTKGLAHGPYCRHGHFGEPLGKRGNEGGGVSQDPNHAPPFSQLGLGLLPGISQIPNNFPRSQCHTRFSSRYKPSTSREHPLRELLSRRPIIAGDPGALEGMEWDEEEL